jgi:ribosome-associated heat shock protein Hsp15
VADSLRLDKFLWFARIVKTRSLAQTMAEQGRIRIGGRVADRAHAAVRVGDVLSFAQRGAVRVLRVEALPARRGPPAEARALYTEIGEGGAEASNSSPGFRGEGDRAPPRNLGEELRRRPLTSEGGGD